METRFLTTTKEIQNSTISRQDYGNNILGQQRITFEVLIDYLPAKTTMNGKY